MTTDAAKSVEVSLWTCAEELLSNVSSSWGKGARRRTEAACFVWCDPSDARRQRMAKDELSQRYFFFELIQCIGGGAAVENVQSALSRGCHKPDVVQTILRGVTEKMHDDR